MAKTVNEYVKEITKTLKANKTYSRGLDMQILSLASARRNRQTLWGGCTDANPKLLLNDT